MLYSQPTFTASSRLKLPMVRTILILLIIQHANLYKEVGLRMCEIDYSSRGNGSR